MRETHQKVCRPTSRWARTGWRASSISWGGKVIRPAQDQFYGERSGTLRDPFGHEWNIGHSIEEVAPEEMQRRYDEMLKTSGRSGLRAVFL